MPSILPRSFFIRQPHTHKGNYGHVVVIGGSIGLTGAPVLCAQAALRAGAGLVTLAVPESVYFIAASKLTEVMVHPLSEGAGGAFSAAAAVQLKPFLDKATCIALGPGLSQKPSAAGFVHQLLKKTKCPVVLDADGINVCAGRSRALLRKSPARIVITPHPGEMARLLGITTEKVQRHRVAVAEKTARDLGVIVVLKGHRTIVAASGEKTYLNSTGNPGMATAGMGDLLAGIIVAFIGQGIDLFSAAKAGVYLHGLAGDIAAAKVGQVSLIASDLLEALPSVFCRA